MRDSYDCLVLGDTPAGCTVAALVAQAGYSALLVPGAGSLPGERCGASLVPEVYGVLQRLGLLPALRSASFVGKTSVQFFDCEGQRSEAFHFPDRDPRECARTWQVERPAFDELLRAHMGRLGVERSERELPVQTLFENGQAIGIQWAKGEQRCLVRGRVVVDATGASLGAERPARGSVEAAGHKLSVWGLYEGVRRDSGDDAGATCVLTTRRDNLWFWLVPLAGNLTSIGVAGTAASLLGDRRKPAQIFEDELVNCPALVERLMQARLAAKLRVSKESTRGPGCAAGAGWLRVAPEWNCCDPVFFSELWLALRSGEMAAASLLEALERQDFSPQQLGGWLHDWRPGVDFVCKVGDRFYAQPGEFLRAVGEQRVSRSLLLDLFMGRVFGSAPRAGLDQFAHLPDAAAAPGGTTLPVSRT